MPSSTTTTAPAPAAEDLANPAGRTWPVWLALAAFAVLWFDLCRQLSYEWSTNDQYAYGWFVPVLALGLFVRKWPTRPLPAPSSVLRPQVPGFLLLLFLTLAYLPLRFIYEINQDWPLISWPLTLCVVGLSLYTLYIIGGWPWIKHFAFPVCFILVAVQWPYRLEHTLTQGLMRVVAAITVELLEWLNTPAMQRGNLIELATGTVGVNEACSGIRSFQSTLMGSLFLGELYLVSWRARYLLIFAGLGIAFVLNVVRTCLLSYQAATAGTGALTKWHDPAGFTIAILTFFALWAVAIIVNKGNARVANQVPSQPARESNLPLFHIPKSFSVCLAVLVGFTLITLQLWYSPKDINEASVTRWSISFPTSMPSFQKLEVPPPILNNLRCDENATGSWTTDEGAKWTIYFFRWNPKSMQSVMRARFHRPEACLPASGLQQISGPFLDYINAGSLRLPFHKYVFTSDTGPLYVFFLLWEDGQEQQSGMRSLTHSDRIAWALAGRRHLGQQTLEIICTGYDSLEDAEGAVRARMPQLIKPEAQALASASGRRSSGTAAQAPE